MGDAQCGADAVVLGQLGHRWGEVELPGTTAPPLRVTVALPADLAAAAVEAWEREEHGRGPRTDETDAQHVARRRAAALAVIGGAVAERGRPDGDQVHVELDAALVALAREAAAGGPA
jgi:hypothetical protein